MLNLSLAIVHGQSTTATPSAGTGATAGAGRAAGTFYPPPSDLAGDKFYIREFRVIGLKKIPEGESMLTTEEIQKVVYPFLGPYRTKRDIQGAREALRQAYREKGYETVDVLVPVQSSRRGIIYLEVKAQTVGRVRVVGSRYYDLLQIKSELPVVQPGTVPNFSEITPYLRGLNGQTDRRVTVVPKEGLLPGTMDFDLNVKDHFPLHGSAEFNNMNFAFSTPFREVVSVSYDNLFQLGHVLNLSYTVAPERPSDEQLFSFNYLARIPNLDWLAFSVLGSKLETDVLPTDTVAVAESGQKLGFRAIIRLPTLESDKGFFHNLSVGIDYKNYQEDLQIASDSAVLVPVTYFPISATYNAGWHHTDGSETGLTAGLTFNVRELGNSYQALDATRFDANGNLMYLNGDLYHTQELPEGFQLYQIVQWQVADQPLVSTEQISAGGLTTVRGYLEGEVLGDNGVVGSTEIRSPSFSRFLGSNVDEWRLYAFSDAAILGLNDAQVVDTATSRLASVGVGSRAQIFNHFNASGDLAFPLLDGSETSRNYWKITFRVWLEF